MSSPFSTFKEFSEAKGPIYTFANNPTMIGILLAISFIISVYFFYASFAMKQEDSKSKDTVVPSILILASVVSFTSSLFNVHPAKQPKTPHHSQSAIATGWKFQPITLFGLVGIGGLRLGRRVRRRSPRQLHRLKSRRSHASARR